MKRDLPSLLTLVLLTVISLLPVNTAAQTIEHDHPGEIEDDEPVQRVGRLSFIEGDVSFLRAGITEWAAAVENLPLFTGDQIYVGSGARAEIQLGRGNYIRLSENTALTVSDLAHTSAQLEITEGVAIIRLERFGSAFERFEVDTPNSALLLQQDGLYRVNVRGQDESEMIVHRGSAEVSTVDGNFKVREGNRLTIDTAPGGKLEIAAYTSPDDWDRWSNTRDSEIDRVHVSSSPEYVNVIESVFNCFYGASELSSHGTWTSVSDYGDCWVPRVAAGWAPYRHGQWLWVPAAGWTWLSSEPWGWAPYHYGRWAYINNLGWAWVPGFRARHYYYGHSYYQWRPALVGFFNCPTSRGDYVGWYPLAPGERWRRPDRFRAGNDHSHLWYPSAREGWQRPDRDRRGNRRPGIPDGVTILPVAGFNRPDQSRVRPEAPDRDLSDLIGKGVRPGLPQLSPDRSASAPIWRRGDDRRSRRVITPPVEIIKRPVVTRNRPSDPQVGVTVPRERRLISPRKPVDLSEVQLPKERRQNRPDDTRRRDAGSDEQTNQRGSDQQGNDSESNQPSRRIKMPRPASPDAAGGDDEGDKQHRREREKRERNDHRDQAQPGNNNNQSGESNQGRERRVPRVELPAPRDRSEKSPGSRGDRDSSSRASEPRQERPQPRVDNNGGGQRNEQRHQEREQRREERREERRQQRDQRKNGQ